MGAEVGFRVTGLKRPSLCLHADILERKEKQIRLLATSKERKERLWSRETQNAELVGGRRRAGL